MKGSRRQHQIRRSKSATAKGRGQRGQGKGSNRNQRKGGRGGGCSRSGRNVTRNGRRAMQVSCRETY